MENNYPPSGGLWQNFKKKSERQPDYTGYLEISSDVVSDLVNQVENSDRAKCSIASWKKVSKKGSTWLRITVEKFDEDRNKTQQKEEPVENKSNIEDNIPF
tara:strand:+ start:93 stop:395 length:303 start_codon:yes stop_codon:yes gene_type:complete